MNQFGVTVTGGEYPGFVEKVLTIMKEEAVFD